MRKISKGLAKFLTASAKSIQIIKYTVNAFKTEMI